ncbi:MAG TPA: calcium/sodium antiporter [Oligoflexia bacterium]|nr:calcium/sodium antiporter [Oligoflexia bacterium]HMP49391.1 calcium/sodium antiporter [Oligoflexia bacterium]
MIEIFILLGGAVALLVGGELLVRGASSFALRLGMSSLLVGLTVVAFGTSAPELFISVQSALDDKGDIALGNVIGSNTCNTLLILGLCALVAPLSVPSKLVRREVPLMVFASVVCFVLSLDGFIGRLDGLLFVVCLFGFLVFSIKSAGRDKEKERLSNNAGKIDSCSENEISEPQSGSLFMDMGLMIFGLFLLYFGSKGFVHGASEIARWFGVSELVIGLTIVALGTSLPEVVTSVLATIRGERDLAVGNVVGSNIFNIFCVLGFCSLISPLNVPDVALVLDIPVMLFSALAFLPIVYSNGMVGRLDGFFFFAGYIVYTVFLILVSKSLTPVPHLSEVFIVFIVPLVLLTVHGFYNRGRSGSE